MKKLIIEKIVFCFIALLFDQTIMSQNISNFLKSYEVKIQFRPSDIVYLQPSKGLYETGEDLWFKGYLLDAQSFELSSKSKTLYLQILSPKDSIVWSEKYPIDNGIAEGHAYIGEKWMEGEYLMTGYTKSSFYNDTTQAIYPRKIYILKNILNDSSLVGRIQKQDSIHLQCFPEGGNLVYNLPSLVAFKVTNGNGMPINVTGNLLEDGNKIQEIKSVHDGMGKFAFIPCLGHQYQIGLLNGYTYSLPAIYSQGITMNLVSQDSAKIEFIIRQSKKHVSQNILLFAQLRGMPCCGAKAYLKDSVKISFPMHEFYYQGIAQITLFDENMHPISERLVYVHPEKQLHISLKCNKQIYKRREEGWLTLKVTDEKGNPMQANIGLSVYDEAYQKVKGAENIVSHCYLSEQIRGNIYNPLYYYDNQNIDRFQSLDLLLLTQGWRRYVWETNSSDYKGQPFLTDEISGKQIVKSKNKLKQRMSSGQQMVKVFGPNENASLVITDTIGNIKINTDIMNTLRGNYVYLQPMLDKTFKPELQISDMFAQLDSVSKNRSMYFTHYFSEGNQLEEIKSERKNIVSWTGTILLDGVTITKKKKQPFRDKLLGKLDSIAQLNIGPWVSKERPHFLNDYYDGYTYYYRGYSGKKLPPVEGKLYDCLKYLPCKENSLWYLSDIKQVIYHGPIYSEAELLRMNNMWKTKGYYAKREFYQPDNVELLSSLPDARTTLLWKPSIVTDKNGEAKVRFNCSDVNTEFIGVVEGVDGNGLLGTGTCIFRVYK